ncbi:MAG TPA: hypothetical protein VGC88_02595 [Terriglobales bacterium]|jgi:hypothetical protein
MRNSFLLFLLGAYHGLNPAMGWLFAAALGMQEKNSRAVINALLPLGVGHLVSVAAVVAIARLLELTLPLRAIRLIAAALLIGFGLFRLIRSRHPKWVGMRVNARDLALWSFLMASAHGAGLMLLPFVLGSGEMHMSGTHAHHLMLAGMAPTPALAPSWWNPVTLHTLGYLLMTASLALLTYSKLGVSMLKRAWFNFDVLWIAALLITGVVTALL